MHQFYRVLLTQYIVELTAPIPINLLSSECAADYATRRIAVARQLEWCV